eukprot:5577590-Prymnesium_polylepis.2
MCHTKRCLRRVASSREPVSRAVRGEASTRQISCWVCGCYIRLWRRHSGWMQAGMMAASAGDCCRCSGDRSLDIGRPSEIDLACVVNSKPLTRARWNVPAPARVYAMHPEIACHAKNDATCLWICRRVRACGAVTCGIRARIMSMRTV